MWWWIVIAYISTIVESVRSVGSGCGVDGNSLVARSMALSISASARGSGCNIDTLWILSLLVDSPRSNRSIEWRRCMAVVISPRDARSILSPLICLVILSWIPAIISARCVL